MAHLSALQTWATPEGAQAPGAPGRGQSSSSLKSPLVTTRAMESWPGVKLPAATAGKLWV